MSWVDDRRAEFKSAIKNAKARIAHGKHFQARQCARTIETLCKALLAEYGTLDRAVEALTDVDEQNKGIVIAAHWLGITLLQVALISPKTIRSMAEALGKLEHTGAKNPRAMAIVDAYEHCNPQPPTFGELKSALIGRFGVDCWRSGDFSVRKTLKWLRLPLAKAKRGRPPGSRSQIGNPRRLER